MPIAARIATIAVAVLVAAVAGSLTYSHLRPHVVERTIEIDASAEQVWQVLTDFAAYPQWNPFLISAEGDAAAGAQLRNTISNNGSTMTFTPTVLVAEPGRELRWLGRFLLPGVVDGEHSFVITPLGENRVSLAQREKFTGFLTPVAGSALDVGDGFAAMNSALKARAEQLNAHTGGQ